VRIFITGGSGFIGSYFHDLLTKAGHELVIYDLVQPPFPLGRSTYIRATSATPPSSPAPWRL
jgi:nucleoside-diphosphate-sugar epimerase